MDPVSPKEAIDRTQSFDEIFEGFYHARERILDTAGWPTPEEVELDFEVCTDTYQIRLRKGGSGRLHHWRNFYSWLQDYFDEPSMMQYPTPVTVDTFFRMDTHPSWTIPEEVQKQIWGIFIDPDVHV